MSFLVDGTKFKNAYTKLESAKKKIGEIKYFLNSQQYVEEGALEKAYKEINKCKIEDLVKFVEAVRANLSDNEEFTAAYWAAWSDTSNLDLGISDEEYALIASKASEQYLLYQLEEYEKNGQLTEEGKVYLEIQRLVVENIDLQEKMNTLSPLDDEYIKAFMQYSENAKKQIEINPKLTEEERIKALEQYNVEYNLNLNLMRNSQKINTASLEMQNIEYGSESYFKKSIELRDLKINYYSIQLEYYNNKTIKSEEDIQTINGLKEAIENEKQFKELDKLYIEGDQDKIRKKKIALRVATEDEIAWENMNGWERAWENTKTIACTVYTSIAGVGENIIDGVVMLTAGTAGWIGEKAGWGDGLSNWVDEFVSVNYKQTVYDSFVNNGTLNSVSAYSAIHSGTDFLATGATYLCLSFIPGVGGSAVMATAAAGSSSQTAYDMGASFDEALGIAWISGGLAFAADFGLDKVNGGVDSWFYKHSNVAGRVVARTVIGMGEPLVNSFAEYFLYGDENYDSFLDYWITSGGLTNMIIGGSVANVSGLISEVKNKKVVDLFNSIETKSISDVDLAKAVTKLDGAAMLGVVARLDDAGLKNLLNNVDSNTFSRIIQNLDDTKLNNVFSSLCDSPSDLKRIANSLDTYSVVRITTSITDDKLLKNIFGNMDDDLFINLIKNNDISFGNKLVLCGTIVSDSRFTSLLSNLGFDSDLALKYLNQNIADIDYDFGFKNFVDGKLSKEIYTLAGISKDALNSLDEVQQQKLYQALISKDGFKDIIAAETLKRTAASSQVLLYLQNGYEAGWFDTTKYSLDDILDSKLKVKSGWPPQYEIPAKKLTCTGADLFPKCDDIISDQRLVDYTLDLLGKNMDDVKAFAVSKGWDLNVSDLELVGEFLEANKSDLKVKGVIFQNATPGASNFQTFKNNLGDTRQAAGDYNITGGAYMMPCDDLAKLAEKYSYCCSFDPVTNEFKITNMEKFGQDVLGGVPLGADGVYMFKCEVDLNSQNVSMPSINNGSMYTAYGVPGGKLLSGEMEVVISGTTMKTSVPTSTDFVPSMDTTIKNGYMGSYTGDGKIINGFKLLEGK